MSSESDPPSSRPSPASDADFTAEVLERLSERKTPYARYQLQGEVARGGQGAILRVWDEDLRRHLAMKVILAKGDAAGETPEVDSKSLGRFLEEAQVTGQLDHPGIVPVHELGLDAEGRTYFTMKLVKGRDLRHVFDLVHAGQEGWTQTRALNVMLKVCEAMAYAHSKGVIHRDLKPGNVMVGKYGEVYVMDWGLARVMGQEDRKDLRIQPAMATSELRSERRASADPDSPLITMDGDVVGTPAYMSPEQARGELDAMGPHSDVYAAGAMLYHLLAGHMPYVPPDARLNNYAVWSHVQSGPPRPLDQVAPDAPAELVAICERAMAREAGHRYADTEALAVDLRAFLEHRVVSAYETGALAELRKWVSRNKPLAVASAAAALALVGGLATSSRLYVEAKEKAEEASDNALRAQANEGRMREERDRADGNAAEAEKQADLARAEAERATREEATTERVLEFLTGMFAQQDPSESRGATITVKEVLDRSAARIEQELGEEPEIKARLMQSMGELYRSLGLFREAEPLMEGALDLKREELGEDHPSTLNTLNNLAELYRSQGRYGEAEPLSVQAFEKKRAVLGEDHPSTFVSQNLLALLYTDQGRYEEAEPLCVQGLERQRVVLGEDHPRTLNTLNNLALLYQKQGRLAEAEPLFVQGIEKSRAVLGEDHLDMFAMLNNLALLYAIQRRYEEAEPLFVQALEGWRAVLGEDHPDVFGTLNNLAGLYQQQGRLAEAEPLYVEALEKRRAVLGEDHPDTLLSMGQLGALYGRQGRFAEAESLLVEALEKQHAALGEDHPSTLISLSNLAVLYGNQGHYAEAEPLYVEALEKRRAVLGEDHPDTLLSLDNLTKLYRSWLSSRREALGESHPDTLTTQSSLGVVLWSQGSHGEAEPLLLDCLEKRTEILDEEHPDTLASLYQVARLHESLQRWEEAEAAAGWLLELTPEDAEEYAEREQLLERVLEAQGSGR